MLLYLYSNLTELYHLPEKIRQVILINYKELP